MASLPMTPPRLIDVRRCVRPAWWKTSTHVNALWHAVTVTVTAEPDPALCCAPLQRAPLSAADAQALARTLKALAAPTRLRLVSLVAAHGGEACVCDLTEPVGLSQPTVSHHLKVLVDAGLVTKTKRATWAFYRAVPDRLAALAAIIAPGSTI